MCGICGEIRFDGHSPDISQLNAMLEVLRPRGPEAQSTLLYPSAIFGHARLKIIDLSDAASQPMHDPKTGLTIVFNGAIYNYSELRNVLISKGYQFFSQGDTEVILKAYAEWGEKCVERFNGMFAFVIYNVNSREIFVARDRLGIKPFYYMHTSDRFVFASSLPALLKGSITSYELDPTALNYYMTFHAVVPAPHTILKSIRKIPPGQCGVVTPEGVKVQPYWTVGYNDKSDMTDEEWKGELHQVMRRSVERRLVADVPVGVLLSGGVDSSLIVGLLDEIGVKDITTFSIGFDTVGDEVGDEFQYSDIIADHFKTNHHKICISNENMLPKLQACIQAMSEPMVSHDVIAFYLLSQEVSRSIKVVQSGQGAGEVFGGYRWYPSMVGSNDPVKSYKEAFFDRNFTDYQALMQPQWAIQDYASQFIKKQFGMSGASDPVDKALRCDTSVMLVDDPVKRVDNMTMAFGLEARVPFLDHEVVELAATMPSRIKIKGGGKYILKEMARRVIPDAVIDRKKGYFPVPALKVVRGNYLEMMKTVLLDNSTRQRRLYQDTYVDQLLADPEKHITPLQGSKLWQITLLCMWLDQHNL